MILIIICRNMSALQFSGGLNQMYCNTYKPLENIWNFLLLRSMLMTQWKYNKIMHYIHDFQTLKTSSYTCNLIYKIVIQKNWSFFKNTCAKYKFAILTQLVNNDILVQFTGTLTKKNKTSLTYCYYIFFSKTRVMNNILCKKELCKICLCFIKLKTFLSGPHLSSHVYIKIG